MNRLKYLTILLNFCITLNAQSISENRIPELVLKTFKSGYSNASKVNWVFAEDSTYQVEFTHNMLRYVNVYQKEGILIEINQELSLNRIPSIINESIQKRFKGYKIITAKSTDKPNKEIVYEIVLKKQVEVYTVIFSKNGKIFSKIAQHD